MYQICKEFTFSASHVLKGLPEGHQCGRMHGHNYRVELYLASPTLDPTGFVVDFGDLHPFKQFVDNRLDHRHLNDVDTPKGFHPLGNPTAENLARWLYDIAANYWPETFAVRVFETDKASAMYSAPPRLPGQHISVTERGVQLTDTRPGMERQSFVAHTPPVGEYEPREQPGPAPRESFNAAEVKG